MIVKDVNLEDLRNLHHISQEYVAKKLNVSVSSYRNKENGTNALWFNEAYILSTIYDCTFDDVFKAMQMTLKKNKKLLKKKK